jgi:hypothetical protein
MHLLDAGDGGHAQRVRLQQLLELLGLRQTQTQPQPARGGRRERGEAVGGAEGALR